MATRGAANAEAAHRIAVGRWAISILRARATTLEVIGFTRIGHCR